MGQRIVWTEPAFADLTSIYEYILRDSKQYAASVAMDIVLAGRSLELFPRRGRLFPELSLRSEIRELSVEPYRLIYRISAELVEILAVVHSSRDVSTMDKFV